MSDNRDSDNRGSTVLELLLTITNSCVPNLRYSQTNLALAKTAWLQVVKSLNAFPSQGYNHKGQNGY